jgi:hypothetical protein
MLMSSRLLVLLFVLLAAAGCRQRNTQPAAPPTWARTLPLDLHTAKDLAKLDQAVSASVLDAKQAEAQRPLADVAWVSIDAERAKELTGKALPSGEGRHLVLLRAVYLTGTKGTFGLRYRDEAVIVDYMGEADSRTSIPMENKALVASLPFLPKEVYPQPTLAK